MNDLPNTALGALRIMPSSAGETARFAKQLIESVKHGEANPLQLIVQLHALTKVYELVREEIESDMLREADKYPEKVIEAFGARLEKSEVGTKYNYHVSKDSEWERLDSEIRALEDKRKERETFLKALKEPITTLNKETGEIEEIRAPLKTSKSGLKIYLKS